MDVNNNFTGRLAISQRMMFDETNAADVVFLKYISISFSDFIYIDTLSTSELILELTRNMWLSIKSESHISRQQLNIRFVLANDEEAWFRCDLVTVEQVVGGPELVEVSVAGVEPIDGDSHVLDDEGDGGGGDEDPG